jgi:hypothetical protein
MNTALIPHPVFSPATPVVTVREIMLACACMDLKITAMEQAEQITRLEEANRALKRRNAELTQALHRTACAGSCIPELLFIGTLAAIAIAFRAAAPLAGPAFVAGFTLGAIFLAFAHYRAHREPRTANREPQPRPHHLEEPEQAARFDATADWEWESIRPTLRELAEAYADEPIPHTLSAEIEAAENERREGWMPAHVTHPEAEAARARFMTTARELSAS